MEKVISEFQKGFFHLREGRLKSLNDFFLVEGDTGWQEGHGALFASPQAGSFQLCCPKKVSFGGWRVSSTGGVTCRNFPVFPCIYPSRDKETEASRVPINLQLINEHKLLLL